MKNYVYLAKDRINTLYDSLGLASQKKNETSFKIDAKIVSTDHSSTETIDVSLVGKLASVLKQIELTDVLDANDQYNTDKQYFKGKLPLAWDAMTLFELPRATFWTGEFECTENDPCSINKIILIGSSHNIIGYGHEAGQYPSFSYPTRFFQVVEDAYESELSFIGSENKCDKNHMRVMKKANSNWIRSEYSSSEFQYECARCIDLLHYRYEGNYCEYEFVAQNHFSFILKDNETKYVRYIVAAPLYVCKTRTFGSRTMIVDGKRKYILSSAEFEEHKKNGFQNLYYLLVNEGLNQEGEAFRTEMVARVNYTSIPWIRLRKRHYTTEDCQDIIDKYFIIINKPQKS